jgi:hypothetical protein
MASISHPSRQSHCVAVHAKAAFIGCTSDGRLRIHPVSPETGRLWCDNVDHESILHCLYHSIVNFDECCRDLPDSRNGCTFWKRRAQWRSCRCMTHGQARLSSEDDKDTPRMEIQSFAVQIHCVPSTTNTSVCTSLKMAIPLPPTSNPTPRIATISRHSSLSVTSRVTTSQPSMLLS